MRNNLAAVLLLALLVSLSYGCSKEISEQEAVSITQNFVNSNVKFYTANESGTETRPEVSISIVGTKKVNDEWYIRLHVQSKTDGESKKSGLIVVVDAKTGEVKKEKLNSFVVE